MISYQVQAFSQPLQAIEHAAPEPQGDECLLNVVAAGVCHTDIHTWHGWYDLGNGNRLSMQERGINLPLTLGHEIVGQVIKAPIGSRLQAGRNYLVYPWIGCGQCKTCRRGDDQLCPTPRFLGIFRPGGYAEHVLVPHEKYLIDIGNLPPAQAAPYACSGLTTFSAIRKINPRVLHEETIVVVGAGGLGLMAVSLLKALGAPRIIVLETHPERRQAAEHAGAFQALDPARPDLADAVRTLAGGGVWAVIDCVGSDQTVQQALDLLIKGGQLILVGLFGGAITLPVPLVPIRAISLQGSYVGRLDELQALMDLVKSGAVAPIPVTCCPLHHAPRALKNLEDGNVTGRTVLQPWSPTPP